MKQIYEEKLQRLNDDTVLLEALKVLIDEGIEKKKPIIDETTNNDVIGEKYRAYHQAKKIFDEVLLEIDSYKIKNINSQQINKGK
jgi:hypothetical protein